MATDGSLQTPLVEEPNSSFKSRSLHPTEGPRKGSGSPRALASSLQSSNEVLHWPPFLTACNIMQSTPFLKALSKVFTCHNSVIDASLQFFFSKRVRNNDQRAHLIFSFLRRCSETFYLCRLFYLCFPIRASVALILLYYTTLERVETYFLITFPALNPSFTKWNARHLM